MSVKESNVRSVQPWSGAAPEENFQQVAGGWEALCLAEYKRSARSQSGFVSQCTRGGRLVARLLRKVLNGVHECLTRFVT